MSLREFALAAAIGCIVAAGDAQAQTASQPPVVVDKRTEAERHQDRADELRRAAEERARANLGYPSVQRDPAARPAPTHPVSPRPAGAPPR